MFYTFHKDLTQYNILRECNNTSRKQFKSDTCSYKNQTLSFFNLKLFSHKISNNLPLKGFLSFICGKTRWVSQVTHSYERNKEKNPSSEMRYPLFFTGKQIICLDGNLLYFGIIADICGVSWKMRCSVSESSNLSLCIKSK